MEFLHEYMDSPEGIKKAKVFMNEQGQYGCLFYLNGNLVAEEIYEGKSERWAEDAAENYALGVKVL